MSGLMAWLRGFLAGSVDHRAEAPEPRPIGPDDVRAALAAVQDPEMGVDIVSLGLIRRIELSEAALRVAMTVTSPACPVGPWMAEQAREALQESFPWIPAISVELEREPAWSAAEMSPEAREYLGFGP